MIFFYLLTVNCLKNHRRNKRQDLPPEFGVQFGTGIIERANRFVACHNKAFLEALIDHHQLHVEYGKTDIITPELFEMLGNT
jgi:hypothetical protein